MILILALCAAQARASGDVAVADYIRLHVLAEDDSPEAQALKLEVRDACLEAARALVEDCGDADEAWAILGENLAALEDAALARARALGYRGTVAAQLGRFEFPDRRYGGLLVPAGEYRALRVVIGAGKGRNWWCVLYPSLCLTETVEPCQPVKFHSVILDWLRRLLGGEA